MFFSLNSSIDYSKEQEKYQEKQLNNEFKMLCDSLDNYNIQIKKLIYAYNEYKKQIPEQYISNKEKSIVLDFEDMGMILGLGCGSPSMTQRTIYPQKAYEFGKSIKG